MSRGGSELGDDRRRKIEPPSPASLAHQMRLLVLQSTPFCNIHCDYCYLPARDDRRRMPFEIVEAAVAFVFESALPAPDAAIAWHAGEPLVLPTAWYREAFRRAAAASPKGAALPHAMQTNGLLINDTWCDLFLEHRVRLGVSVDGPAFLHDARRRTRSGTGTQARVMKGIETLQRRGVPFHVITVVTERTLDAARELLAFYRSAGISDIGFNIEEVEGVNVISSLEKEGSDARFRDFLAEVVSGSLDPSSPLNIREYRELLAVLAHPRFGRLTANSQNAPFAMLTVSAEGDLFTFSPELAGLKGGAYGSMAVGKLPGATLDRVLAGAAFRRLWADIAQGISACRDSCRYFDLCLGGAPSNKLAEHGTFNATETLHCRLARKAVADVVLADLERRLPAACASGGI